MRTDGKVFSFDVIGAKSLYFMDGFFDEIFVVFQAIGKYCSRLRQFKGFEYTV